LEISVEVDLDDSIRDGIKELLLRRSRPTVEDEENWLLFLSSDGVLNKLLVLAEELWVKLDISWLVHTVDITETSGDREVRGNWLESLVNGKDILRLGVEGVVVDILVVDTVLLTTSNTDFLKALGYRLLHRNGDVPFRATASLGQHA
jgi:hypothetical protein